MPHGGFVLVFGVYPEMFQQTDMSNLKMHKSDEYDRLAQVCNMLGYISLNNVYVEGSYIIFLKDR